MAILPAASGCRTPARPHLGECRSQGMDRPVLGAPTKGPVQHLPGALHVEGRLGHLLGRLLAVQPQLGLPSAGCGLPPLGLPVRIQPGVVRAQELVGARRGAEGVPGAAPAFRVRLALTDGAIAPAISERIVLVIVLKDLRRWRGADLEQARVLELTMQSLWGIPGTGM
jgi:hypothetical protein